MAVKAARDWARIAKPGARSPEIIVPETAHPAFDKAAHLLGLRVVRMRASPDYRADVAAMAQSVGENTVMIVGSAPPYPYGVVDPIEAIADIALEHDLWMHVDGCIGGFLLPFMEELGQPMPRFDFRVGGVRSMSADLHKYGYANRGSSCLLLRERGLEAHQRFTNGDWPAGVYSTLNFAGSRAGGPVASAWAVLNYLGYEGYLERAEAILQARRAFTNAIGGIADLTVLGEPQAGHFAFAAKGDLDMAAVADGMEEKGWHFARLRRPPAMMLLLNFRHGAILAEFMADLAGTIERVRGGSLVARGEEAVYIG
jgi:glutamate/tyrosine decarboxylase-like PLP-dependent enzyme